MLAQPKRCFLAIASSYHSQAIDLSVSGIPLLGILLSISWSTSIRRGMNGLVAVCKLWTLEAGWGCYGDAAATTFCSTWTELARNDYVASIDMACQLHHSSCLQHGIGLVLHGKTVFLSRLWQGDTVLLLVLDLHFMTSLLMVNPAVGVFHCDQLHTAVILYMFACMHFVIKFRRDGDWTGEPG